MVANKPEPDKTGSHTILVMVWVALLGVWIATPFMGDRVAPVLTGVYWAALIGSSLVGLVLAFRYRRLLLGLAGMLTLLAWPIVLGIALVSGGIA